jgi:hypothetical protein
MQCTLNKCHGDVYTGCEVKKRQILTLRPPYCLWAKPTITKQKALFTIYWTYTYNMYNGKIGMSACFKSLLIFS